MLPPPQVMSNTLQITALCVCLQIVRWQSLLKYVIFSAIAKGDILNCVCVCKKIKPIHSLSVDCAVI